MLYAGHDSAHDKGGLLSPLVFMVIEQLIALGINKANVFATLGAALGV